jgi:hypothetical protein
MKSLGLLVIVILFVVLAVTNPNEASHKQMVVNSAAAKATNSELLGRVAGDMLGNADVVPTTYNNYYLFSTTTFNGKTSSFGVCSRVWSLK